MLEVSPKVVGVFPDEVCEAAVVAHFLCNCLFF
jgi:hypothetical protein